jgi:CheY-like chemotaxis protein
VNPDLRLCLLAGVTEVMSGVGFVLETGSPLLVACPTGVVLPKKQSSGRTALVVDDSMLIRHTVCRFLEERGFVVESATNGQEALEVLKRVRPDLIVTDMQMPKMGGSELITSLKAQAATVDIPIVIVAGRQSGFNSQESRADFAIYKDIDIETQLATALESLMGSRVRAQAAGRD